MFTIDIHNNVNTQQSKWKWRKQSHEYLEAANMLVPSANLVTIIINKHDLELPGSPSKKGEHNW